MVEDLVGGCLLALMGFHKLLLLLLAIGHKLLKHLGLSCHGFSKYCFKVRNSSIDVSSISAAGASCLGGVIADGNSGF